MSLLPCPSCGRTFQALQSRDKHAAHCATVFKKKRPQFDSRKMRLTETQTAPDDVDVAESLGRCGCWVETKLSHFFGVWCRSNTWDLCMHACNMSPRIYTHFTFFSPACCSVRHLSSSWRRKSGSERASRMSCASCRRDFLSSVREAAVLLHCAGRCRILKITYAYLRAAGRHRVTQSDVQSPLQCERHFSGGPQRDHQQAQVEPPSLTRLPPPRVVRRRAPARRAQRTAR